MSPHKRKLMALCVDAVKRGGLMVTSLEIARSSGVGFNVVAKLLSVARADGLVKTSRRGISAVWFLPENEAAALAQIKAESYAARRALTAKRYAKMTAASAAAKAGEPSRFPPAMMTALDALGGKTLTVAQIAEDAGLSEAWTKTLMFHARKAGLVRNTAPRGVAARWQAVREHVQADEAPPADDSDPIVQRIGVSASAPLPFVCRAAASVFHLGAGL